MRTTIGQLIINDALPEDMRDYSRTLDKNGIKALFKQLAEDHPEQYKDVAQSLMQLGQKVSHWEGSSISLSDLKQSNIKKRIIPALQRHIDTIVNDNSIDQKEKDTRVVEAIAPFVSKMQTAVLKEGLEEGNNLAVYAASGARGNKSHLNQMRGSPLLVLDNKNEPVAVPIMNSYSDGLDPAELWAASYGVRAGYTNLKGATPKAGYFGKQLANAAHRLAISDTKPQEGTGLPVQANDPDNEGSVLADDYGVYKAGTVLTPKVIRQISKNNDEILVHSPISSVSPGGGIPQLAAGYREKGGFVPIGDNIGIAAAQSISEPLAQAAISSKHIAGVAGGGGKGATAEAQAGFDVVNRLANIPKTFAGKATVADMDGTIAKIEEAPQGGWFVFIGDQSHYVSPERNLSVKSGEHVEAGDALSDGIPNPAEIVKHKGIGEGRRYFMERFYRTLQDSGVPVHRRNVELISRALINHVRVTNSNSMAGSLPDDIVEYDDMASSYAPRPGSSAVTPSRARGKYLEQPVLHYSIGTRITPRVMTRMKKFGVKQLMVHNDEPQFVPEMQRAVDVMGKDPDWMVQLAGFQLKKNLLKSVHRGAKSELSGTSYIPQLARGADFGR